MEIKIIFNSKATSLKLSIGWGISCLVDNNILFDTGEKGGYFLNNIEQMNIDISCLKAVVISHDHWDHTGGLWELLNQKPGIKVYACPNFSLQFKKKVKQLNGILVEADGFVEIAKDIFITGEIPGEYKEKYLAEQALILKTKNGISIITGCAHPGIIKIIEKVKTKFPEESIFLVFGGFHLMNKDKGSIENIADKFKKMGVEKAGPTHCSGKEAEKIFKKEYGDAFITVKAGQIWNV